MSQFLYSDVSETISQQKLNRKSDEYLASLTKNFYLMSVFSFSKLRSPVINQHDTLNQMARMNHVTINCPDGPKSPLSV